jgi:PBP1b-binding outer membrane lipoprotein LpoB
MIMKRLAIPLLLAFLLILVGCSSSTESDPAQAVEKYLQAKIKGDEKAMRPLLCARMEADLEREVQSFSSVSDVKIQDMACKRDGNTDVVRCTGKIVATYGTENNEFPLGAYNVVKEDGEWKWCGEAG